MTTASPGTTDGSGWGSSRSGRSAADSPPDTDSGPSTTTTATLSANVRGQAHGVFAARPGLLSNDFFKSLLDLTTTWKPVGDGIFDGTGPGGKVRWTATADDLLSGSNAEFRAIVEVHAYDAERFQADSIATWSKVMMADRFELVL